MSTAPNGIDPEEWKKWDEKSKQRLIAALEASEKKKKVWYCPEGRGCDGKPHGIYDYGHARGDQWPPVGTDWLVWLLKGGRGSGKTRSGAEWIRKMSETLERTSIIGPSWAHVRDTMIEGDSGLLAVFDSAKMTVLWEPSKRKLTVPCKCPAPAGRIKHRKGHFIQAFTGEEPERLRGPQHAAVWLDEPAHFALIEATWDNMMFGLRLGKRPVVLCSTTPLPTKWMKKLIAEPDTVSITVSTYKNMDNLAPSFKKVMLAKYEGTRLGRQELHGEVLDDIVGALWNYAMIEPHRVERVEEWIPGDDGKDTLVGRPALTYRDMERIVIGIDPAGTSAKNRDETGIVVVGKRGDQYYVIDDASDHYTPDGWAKKAWELYDKYEADKVIAEKNYGGEMVLSTLKHSRPDGPVDLVTSRRGKALRAEPIVAIYEQGRVHHFTQFEELETQMTEWVPGKGDSPDRVDALVHGITALAGIGAHAAVAIPTGNLGRGGLAGLGGGLKHLGWTPREPEAPVLPHADTALADPDCLHVTVFESHTEPGINVCQRCLAELAFTNTISGTARL